MAERSLESIKTEAMDFLQGFKLPLSKDNKKMVCDLIPSFYVERYKDDNKMLLHKAVGAVRDWDVRNISGMFSKLPDLFPEFQNQKITGFIDDANAEWYIATEEPEASANGPSFMP